MSPLPERVPRYDDLPVIEATGDRHCWGVFGPEDRLGTVNFLTPERVRRACALVKKGEVFPLSLPLDQPQPPLVRGREPYRHTLLVPDRNARDEVIDNFYPQFSTQIDGLLHIRYREFGFYGGRQEEEARRDLGIDVWARHGIAGRGVLVDIARLLERKGTPLDYRQPVPIGPDLLEEALREQGTALEGGDILLVHTGWLRWYLSLPLEERSRLGNMRDNTFTGPGLAPGRETARFLWDHQVAMVAVDNPGVEKFPITPQEGFLHRRLIPLLGMPLGELWWLHDLAEACKRDGNYQCLVIAVPLPLPGGVGSPANALAIR